MIAVGIDTHKERHCAAALDEFRQVLGELAFTATAAGYADFRRWAESHGNPNDLVSASRAPAAGAPASASICNTPAMRRRGRMSAAGGASHREVRPHRRACGRQARARRREGLDPAPPRDSLGGEGAAERPAIHDRGTHRLLNQLQALNVTAPVTLRERIGDGTGKQLERRLLAMRSRAGGDIEERAVLALCVTSRPAHAHSPSTPNATNTTSPSSSAHSRTPSSTSPGSALSQARSCSPAIPRAADLEDEDTDEAHTSTEPDEMVRDLRASPHTERPAHGHGVGNPAPDRTQLTSARRVSRSLCATTGRGGRAQRSGNVQARVG